MVSPPASKADGRRKPVWEFDSPALRHLVPGGHLGEIPKLDKGPPWNGGRRALPVRGFESHSLRCRHQHRRTREGYPSWTRGRFATPLGRSAAAWVRIPLPPPYPARQTPALEAIRMVEEPGLNPGRPSGLRAFESPRFRVGSCRRSSMDRAPVYEAGCSRFDPWRRRSGGSPASPQASPSRRSSAGQSAALRRRRPHVRVVPARLGSFTCLPCGRRHALVAQRMSTPPVRARTGFDPQRGLSSPDDRSPSGLADGPSR